jgi:hypothetical protein
VAVAGDVDSAPDRGDIVELLLPEQDLFFFDGQSEKRINAR